MMFFLQSCQKNSSTKNKQLKISFYSDPQTADPRKSGDLISSTLIIMLNNGLTLKENGQLKLAIAKSYEISEDGKEYTFHLRDCYWSDGVKITAYDFEKSWKKVIDPNFPSLCPQLFYPIKNAEKAAKGEVDANEVDIHALDAKTLKVILENPTPYFLSLTSSLVYYPTPSHIVEKDPNWATYKNKKLVTNGPFILSKWDSNRSILLEKNPMYWNKQNIKLDSIHISIINDENTALQMFQLGKLDLLGTAISPLPIDSIPTLKNQKALKSYEIAGSTFCTFNTTKFPFNNKKIRQAFSMTIKREDIVNEITQLNEPAASRIFPPVLMNGKNRQIIESYNLQKAKQLFEEGLNELNAKAKDIKLTFSITSSNSEKKLAETLQEHWQKAFNIKINIEKSDSKTMLERFHKHDYQFGLRIWLVQYFDAMNILERFKYKNHPKNFPNWENQNYIELLDKAICSNDIYLREKILEKAEDILADEMPITPIYHWKYATLVNPRIKNANIGPIGDLAFERIIIEDEN
jgi:oligopeptide transport system substrate-binding protein